MRGRYERQKPKKKTGKIILITLIVVVMLLAGVAGGAYLYVNSLLGHMQQAQVQEREPEVDLGHLIATMEPEETAETTAPTVVPETTVPETKPMTADDIINVLVVGQSARPGEDSRMADSTMLVTVNKYTKTVTLTSVLRDAFVKYPKYKSGNEGRCKLASAYAVAYSKWDVGGAMEVMNLLMEQNFGVEVDYNFEIDMEMFMAFVNALDGLQMDLTEAEANYLNKELKGYCDLEAGRNDLDGFMALTYARMRKAEGDNESDIVRVSRQRYLVERMIKKVAYKLGTEGLPAVQNLCTELLPYVTTNMEPAQITKLMVELLPMVPELKIEGGNCPAKSKGELFDIYGDGQLHSILRFDVAENKKIMRAITEGEIAP